MTLWYAPRLGDAMTFCALGAPVLVAAGLGVTKKMTRRAIGEKSQNYQILGRGFSKGHVVAELVRPRVSGHAKVEHELGSGEISCPPCRNPHGVWNSVLAAKPFPLSHLRTGLAISDSNLNRWEERLHEVILLTFIMTMS